MSTTSPPTMMLPSDPQTLYLTLLHRKAPIHPFIYAVLSTKIFCLPGCPSRLARRINISFYPDPASARAAGFRPCKRCCPDDCFQKLVLETPAGFSSSQTSRSGSVPDVAEGWQGQERMVLPAERRQIEVITRACALLVKQQRNGRVRVTEVAKEVGLTKWHFGRVFRKVMGVGPVEWTRRQEDTTMIATCDENMFVDGNDWLQKFDQISYGANTLGGLALVEDVEEVDWDELIKNWTYIPEQCSAVD